MPSSAKEVISEVQSAPPTPPRPVSTPPSRMHSPAPGRSPLRSTAASPLASPIKKAVASVRDCLEEVGHITRLADPRDAWLPITESRSGNAYYAAFHNLSSGIGFQALVLPVAFAVLGWCVVGHLLPHLGVRVAALHVVAARQAPRARRGWHPVQPVHAPRHDRFRREVGQDPRAAPGFVPVGGELHGAHRRGRREHEVPVQHRVRRGVPGASADHRGVVPRLHLRGRAAVPAPQPQLHRRRVAGGRHRGRRVLHHDLGRVRGQGEGARRVLRAGQGRQRCAQRTWGPEWPGYHCIRFQGAQSCPRDSGHHAIDAEASFSCAHVEGRQASLCHCRALLVPHRHWRLLGLWQPDTSERHPERSVQVPHRRRVPAGAGNRHAAGGHQLPDHLPNLRHAGVRQHGGRVRAQEGPPVPVVAALGLPRDLRGHQLPRRRRAAVPLGARRRPRGDLAAGHAGVPVLHVGGDQEAGQGLGDVEHQLGSRNLRRGPKLCAHSWKSVGSCGERIAGAVLQAREFPVKTT